jgi:CelD/BcsL family acetyltransferase involved in cellulose biosynthesis
MPRQTEVTGDAVDPRALTPHEIGLWTELMENAPQSGSPFLAYTYAATAAKTLQGVRVCRVRADGRTVGFFPFQFRTPLHRLFGIAQPVSDHLTDDSGLVAAPGLALTPRRLMQSAGLNAQLFTQLSENQRRFGLEGERSERGFRIRMPRQAGTAWERLRQGSKKLVLDTERRERKLAEAHGTLRFVFDHADPVPSLRELIAAKRAQYRRTRHRDALAAAPSRHFLELLSVSRDPQCRGVLSTLYAGGTWVASHFGLMHGGTLHYSFPAYNSALNAYSSGRQLLAAIIRSAGENGVACIDRGAGDSPAKQAFAPKGHAFQRGFWYRPHVSSVFYRAGLALAWRTRGALVRLTGDGLALRSTAWRNWRHGARS